MSANIELERVATLLDETVDFVRINLKEEKYGEEE